MLSFAENKKARDQQPQKGPECVGKLYQVVNIKPDMAKLIIKTHYGFTTEVAENWTIKLIKRQNRLRYINN